MEKLLQKLADFICDRIKNAKTQQEVNFWFITGLMINDWCVERNIWLD